MHPDDRPLLLIGETYNTADGYYAVRCLFGDPIIFLDKGDADSVLVCSDFERATAATRTRAVRTRGFQDYGVADLPSTLSDAERIAALALNVLRVEGVSRATTTNTMPLSVADFLRVHEVDLTCQPDYFVAGRLVKGLDELSAIESVQHATEKAMAAAVELIARATVGKDSLLYEGGRAVTSERLHAVIDASLLEDGCSSEGAIAAGGPQSAEPHNTGSGAIRAGQPVVIDIFPRHKDLRYFSDMTRTVSKGEPDAEIVRMYDLTRAALDHALSLIKPGVSGHAVFEAVCRLYEENGYPTYLRENKMPTTGFIHGLGHGVGLDIHEGPSLGRRDDVLREGQVITVEPGLYTPGLGGVRLEDIVVVTADGLRNLTAFPRQLVV